MIDPTFRIIAPPVDTVLTALDAVIATRLIWIDSAIILVALFFALRDWGRSQSPIMFLLLIGGAITNLAEPFVDLAGACWHPIIGQNTIFENMDRPMPLWLLFSYVSYFGVLPMFIYQAFRKGASTRAMWLWFLVPVIADIVLEESLLSQAENLYVYYANQPLKVHTFPLWWAAGNTIGVYLSAVVMTLFAPLLRGWRLALAPFSTLLCYTAASGFVAWPSTVVINSEFSNVVTQLGGIASFLIAFLVVHGCTRLIATDSPYNVRKAITAQPV
jgi:hypothetical protein